MSFEGNDMLLRVLAERIKKKKLEEKALPVDAKIGAKSSEPAKYFHDPPSSNIGKSPSNRNAALKAIQAKFDIPPRISLASKNQSYEFLTNLRDLLKKGGQETQLSRKDIVDSKDEAGLIKAALALANNTVDDQLRDEIIAILKSLDTISDTVNAPASGTVDPLGASSDIDIEQIQSMTFPEVNISDAAMNAGQFFGSQNDLINSVFTAGTIKERCAQFTAASKAVFAAAADPDSVKPKDVRKVIQYAMFTDLCNTYFNLMDARNTGHSFESLCAIFCGGKVIGGGNGAADFVTNSGTQGSSKKYSNWSGIKQSAVGFGTSGDKSKVLHYVIGMPVQTKVADLNEEEKAKFSDPDTRTAAVKLYYVVVSLVKEREGIGHFVTSDPNGNPMSYQTIPLESKNYVDVIKNADQSKCLVGEFQLYSGKNSFKKVLDDKTKDNQSNFAKAYKKVNEFFKLMKQADEDSRKYISQSSKEPNEILSHGNAAMEKMTKADSALEDMLKLLKPEGTTGDIATSNGTRTISESRQIADVVKEMKEKELKKR